MFEKSLSDKLKRIFDLKKVSFNHPGESQEQECVFIEIEKAKSRLKDGKQVCHVVGKLHVFGNSDKMPYGYFNKKISEADKLDTQDLFFYDFEENAGTFMNISERSMSFIYLYDSQYDPAIGELNELKTSYGS